MSIATSIPPLVENPPTAAGPDPRGTGSATIVWLVSVTCIVGLLGLAAASGPALRIAFPLAASAIGFVLYLRRPIAYIHFTLWIWFLSPLIRRLVDFRFGYEEQNFVLLAPYLVSSIAVLTVFRDRTSRQSLNLTPFVLCASGALYGFSVGIIRFVLHSSAAESVAEIIYGLFRWLAPLVFGLHLYLRWPSHDAQERAIQKTFVWAVFLLGVYGIIQFVVAPKWDCVWLEGLPGGFASTSFGRPEPYGIRVWSTLNAPGPFAGVMLAGLIILFVTPTKFKLVTATAGYVSLLLSLVRTAWIGWVLAMVILLSSFRGATLRRYVLGLLLIPFCLLPVLFSPQIQTAVQDRLQSLQSGQQDGSFQERKAMYAALGAELIDEPSGIGLVNEVKVNGFSLDSGFLQTVLMLGFTGAAIYAVGILMGASTMFAGPPARSDTVALAYRAIFLVSLVELVSGNSFVNVGGLVLWMSLGMWMSTQAKAANGTLAPSTSNRPFAQGSGSS